VVHLTSLRSCATGTHSRAPAVDIGLWVEAVPVLEEGFTELGDRVRQSSRLEAGVERGSCGVKGGSR